MGTLLEIIRDEIHKSGVLPFARFMELALYCPDCGYYETKKDIGRHGDFFTSVSVGPLFGELLARQFAAWLEEMSASGRGLKIMEAGAHDGRLAADILNWLQLHRPKLFPEIEYVILEPSTRRRGWQKETLQDFVPRIRWVSDFQVMAGRDSAGPEFHGIIFSNELLDAFPVHRFGWDAQNRTWFEWGVTSEGDNFVWMRIKNSEFSVQNSELETALPDGYIVETCPGAENWWRQAARVLTGGRLLAIDYGFTDSELFSPARSRGTLRAYFRHQVADDLLANPGRQDLTAHVNFSAIQKAGEAAGLKTDFFGSQAKFLTGILENTIKAGALGGWTPKLARQFQTLTHPEHLGRAFRVLVQSR
ncbi:MAG TPA: SAM-dependent methyltransferase [Verrucomicrobiae bacterium]|nr:SAM-dependent methyltransferase [Verrucomicrobiae bacterium]